MVSNPLVAALDVPTSEEALRLARLLAPSVGAFKVGLGLLMGPGPAITKVIASTDRPVFVDAKLHDIPSVLRRAAEQIALLGARWVTVHASAGPEALSAAVDGIEAGRAGRPAGVLAVTVLTSLSEAALAKIGVSGSPGRQTARLARLAQAAGCEGVVCPGSQLGVVAASAPGLLRVVPGIRPLSAAPDDQVQVLAPAEATARGADLIVVGRPIISAPDPRRAAEMIRDEALAGRESGARRR